MKRYIPLLIIATIMVAIFASGWYKHISFQSLADNRALLTNYVSENFLLASLVFILGYAAATSLSIPGASVISITGGFLFGTWFGGSWILIGATLGACLLFFAVKTAFGETLREKAGPWVAKVQDGFSKDAFSYLLFLRLVPAFPFFVVNIVPALLSVKFRTYLVATFIGIMPGCFVFASIGSGIGSIFDSGEVPTIGDLITWNVIGPLAGLAALACIPIIIKKFKKN
jgi:uncharacterized membrane protein YdjX (TVP38/TMEM64 family)